MAQVSCASPAALDAQLDRVLLSLRPGLSMKEISSLTSTDPEMLIVNDGKLLLFVSAKSGHRLASIQLRCSVDDSHRLQECAVAGERSHMQSVTEEQLRRLRKGQALGTVVSSLCAPEHLEATVDGGVRLHYTTDAPPDWYLPLRPVVVSFGKSGQLQKVEQPR